jgi:hypothetical protein
MCGSISAHVEEVLAATGKLLDFTKPVGLLFVACHDATGKIV